MPDPLSTLSLIASIWKESKPLRSWLWDKLPMAKDSKQRDVVETRLARLLDDANKLAQALPQEALDAKLQELIGQFRTDLAQDGIKGADAENLVERATLLTKLYVTGPLGDLVSMRVRLAEDEQAIAQLEKSVQTLTHKLAEQETALVALSRSLHRQLATSVVGLTIGAVGLVLALVALLVHR